MTRTIGTALPRVGLLGNPSDGYGGRVLAFTFTDFRAEVTITDSERFRLDTFEADSWSELLANPRRFDGAAALLSAGLARFTGWCERTHPTVARSIRGSPPLALTCRSDIPFEVGLAGSSAILIAELRALARRFAVEIAPAALAALALSAETDDLGIAAGPQDRVVQAHEGLLFMDFSGPLLELVPERLDPTLLPPLFVAWAPEGGERSGRAHDRIRARWERGEASVRTAIARFPRLATEGRESLLHGEHARFRSLIDANFDARASIWNIRELDRRLVTLGREAGAAVKFCGSGGAVVGVLPEDVRYAEIAGRYRAAGFGILRPNVGRTAPEGAR